MDQQTEKLQLDNLDLEFKKILCVIRQHIPYVNSNAYLMQCRIWLEKLSSSNTNKRCRNFYLAELCKQIKANKLLPPFNEAPPRGDLKKLTRRLGGKTCEAHSSQMNILYSSGTSTTTPQNTSANLKQAKTNSTSMSNIENWEYAELSATDEELHEVLIKTPTQNLERVTPQFSDNTNNQLETNNTMSCGEPIKSHCESEGLLQGIKSKESGSDNDSWSDVTEASSITEFKPAMTDENGVQHNKNANSGDTEKGVSLPNSCKRRSRNALTKINLLDLWQSENSSANLSNVQQRVQQEPELKFLNDTNYLAQDWKKTIEALQLRLSEMIQQNNELNTIIQKLERQLENNRNNNKAQSIHNQEIANLKEIHGESCFQLEESYKAKIKSISSDYEQKISDIVKRNADVMNKKDSEVSRLSEIIQDQCLRIMNDISSLKNQVSNCTCDKKVHILKKCVSKMDKLFQKSEKEYIKQIEHLKQEMEVKENSLQVQLKIQKAELIAQTRTGQKEEFEDILNSLEVKYIQMLEAHEHQIMKTKKQDDDRIQYLTQLLERNGISYYTDNFEYGYQ